MVNCQPEEQAAALLDPINGVLFTCEPDSRIYHGNVSDPSRGEGHSQSLFGAGARETSVDLGNL
jgi:hypothetical protein